MTVIEQEDAVRTLTEVMAKFTSYIGKRLPTDVQEKLAELREKETHPLAKAVYQSMKDNQEAADKLDRPSCQDTGVIQYFITAGAKFPLLGELEDILREATAEATRKGPLRHNAVETFDEKNTGTNTGSKIPWLDWEINPGDDSVTIEVYMAGGGCAVLAATKVEKIEGAEWKDLGMPETLWINKVNEFGPLIISIDTKGNNLIEQNKARFNEKKKPILDRINAEVRFIS